MENLNEKYVGAQREFRAKKILKWIYDTIYYSATTVFYIHSNFISFNWSQAPNFIF